MCDVVGKQLLGRWLTRRGGRKKGVGQRQPGVQGGVKRKGGKAEGLPPFLWGP